MSTVERVPIDRKLMVSVEEATELIPLSEQTIRRLIRRGVIRRVPDCERVMIARIELERWAASSSPESLRVWEASCGRPVQLAMVPA